MSILRRIAYLCADPNVAPDGNSGAASRFRSLARAFGSEGTRPDVFMVRKGNPAGFDPHRTTLVTAPREPGAAGEIRMLGHAAALLDAMKANRPHVAVYERLSVFSGAGLAYARAAGIPYAVEVSSPLWQEGVGYSGLHFAQAARSMCLDVLTAADLVIPVSGVLADELMAHGVPGRRIHVQGNGADVTTFAHARPADRPPALRNRPTLLYLGRLETSQGIDFLLQAFESLHRQVDAGLWIVGDGPGAPSVQAACERFPDSVVHTPTVEQRLVPGILQAADVVVLPLTGTAPGYASPLRLVEPLAARRPLVASSTACVTDTLAELGMSRNFPGLFDADDETAFVAAVLRVLRQPESARASATQVAPLDWRAKAREVIQLMGLHETHEDEALAVC